MIAKILVGYNASQQLGSEIVCHTETYLIKQQGVDEITTAPGKVYINVYKNPFLDSLWLRELVYITPRSPILTNGIQYIATGQTLLDFRVLEAKKEIAANDFDALEKSFYDIAFLVKKFGLKHSRLNGVEDISSIRQTLPFSRCVPSILPNFINVKIGRENG